MSITAYTQGDLVDFPFSIVDEQGTLVDPDIVEFNFTCGTVGPIKFTYTGASAPGTNTVWRTGTGEYRARVDTTSMSGTFKGAGISRGVGQAVGSIQVIIIPNPLLP